MKHYHDAAVAAAKSLPAWLGVYVTHVVDDITISGIAGISTIIYSVVQIYISIQRYRKNK